MISSIKIIFLICINVVSFTLAGTDGTIRGKVTDEESMEQVERKHIQKVLESCDGNRTHAAKKLGLNVRTLRNKIKEYDLDN